MYNEEIKRSASGEKRTVGTRPKEELFSRRWVKFTRQGPNQNHPVT